MSAISRLVIVGDEPLAAQCGDIALAHGLDVVLVATTNHFVREWADERGIAAVAPRGPDLLAGLDDHPADALLSIANLRLIPEEVLSRVATAINFHDGPLPAYAGLNVTSWALLAGEREHAVTWHLMTSDVDAGAVVATESFAVDADETAFSLNARCYEAALATFPQIAAALVEGRIPTTPQPDGVRHVYMRHDRPAVLFDPARPAAEIVRAIRALDLGHRLRNSIGSVRWIVDDDVLVIDSAAVGSDPSGRPAGTVVGVDDAGVRVATADGDVLITALSTATGRTAIPAELVTEFGISEGRVLPSPDAALVDAIAELEPSLSKDELFWIDRVARQEPTSLSIRPGGDARDVVVDAPRVDPVEALAAVVLWLSRVGGSGTVSFGITDARTRETLRRTSPLTRPPVSVIDLEGAATLGDLRDLVVAELDQLARRQPVLHDAIGRDPRTRGRDLAATVVVDLESEGDEVPAGGDVTLRIAIGEGVRLCGVAHVDDPEYLDRAGGQIGSVVRSFRADPTASLSTIDMIGDDERAMLEGFNATGRDHDRTATIATLFHAQVARTPDRAAASFGERTLTYAQLESAAAALGRRLAAAGIGRHDRVGIAVPRGLDMLAGVIATLDLGAAYVPLDPTYPIDRLRFMVEDSGIKALLATGATTLQLRQPGVVVIDPSVASADGAPTNPILTHDPADLAYVIYTSGSTGTPKGVMLEHRQVTNFFVAMDQVIEVPDAEGGPPAVWLAVTSLSFDISVLELLWTVTRGFHVVIKADRGIPIRHGRLDEFGVASRRATGTRPVSFSLFYFAAGEDTAADGYRLLLESARFADANGFEAVWTPERHFHAFGGAYPNPSVAGAALAAITEHVAIRAGSVVLPLHSPIRVAEEWAVVDNISRGRVGISFAAGWQPNDFVLNPAAYATAKEDLPQRIDTVQRLWRGETVSLPGHDGNPVDVRTLPRPVQPELPVWLTSAGSPATFERAGTLGVNVLTHLLGQSIDQLAENLQRYRAAWREAGHAGEGRVTLMMHTYLDRDADAARETAREPMKAYLSTAVGLLRDVASAFPTFAGRGKNTDDLFKSLTPDEMDQLLEVAAHRYLSTSGLFGTPDDVADVVEQVSAAGVDEVACLIDFGVETDLALGSLHLLLEAKALVDEARSEPLADASYGEPEIDPATDTVAALVAKHGVTHLQCTPSLAAMLVADPADREALGAVRHLMLGGEALSTALAAEIRDLLPGRFTNMYGPTETTIWSLVHEVDGHIGDSIPIGKPIANTTVFVLDRDGGRLGVGAFGELHIGGEGVARGYHNRPELTAERFVDRAGMGRVYATGDVVRIHPDGHVEFAGRADNQVKIRGHRIELGEIETVIDRHPDVVQSVVIARTDSGDIRLVAYAVVHHGAEFTAEAFADAVRKFVGDVLPDVMVPAAVVRLDGFPLTPNGKIDRKALPAPPSSLVSADVGTTAPPADDVEQLVADIWVSELERPVGRDDNFFDIGGHSLLAVKVFRRLTDSVAEKIALTDIFRFPTVRTFAAHLAVLRGGVESDAAPAVSAPAGTDRGAMRRRAMARRSGAPEE